jgi:hypothetical protein
MQKAVTQINEKNPWSAPAASPPPQFDIQNFAGAGAQPTRLVDMTQTAPNETPSAIQTPTPHTVATPTLDPNKDKKDMTTSAQPTVPTTGQPQPQQTGNRYIDMLMAGPEAQREAEQHANIIETIRGTPGTSTGTHDRNAPSNTFGYFNPNNPRAREYSDKIGAITGMDRDVALGLHGVDAPIQGQLAQEGIRQAGAFAAARAGAQKGHAPQMTVVPGDHEKGSKLAYFDGTQLHMIDPHDPSLSGTALGRVAEVISMFVSGQIDESNVQEIMSGLTAEQQKEIRAQVEELTKSKKK